MRRVLVAAFYLFALPAFAGQMAIQQLVQGQLADERGFINIWQLRNDVMRVEAVEASDDTGPCHSEADPDAPPPGRKERRRLIKQEKDCVKQIQRAFANYQAVRKSFNAKWQRPLLEAIRLGDPVAEVIWAT